MSDLRQALDSDRLVLTAGCVPPRGGAEAVGGLSAALPAGLDAVVVADNPDEIHGSALACAALLVREGRSPVLCLSARDRNRIALESDALGASALGIGAVLCVSGNHQSLGVCPQAATANDLDSTQLVRMVKGLDLPGLLVGAVAHPYQRPLELNLLRMKKKIAAGAEFLVTQPVFDLEEFTRWMEAVRESGFDRQAAIIAGVLPLTSAEKAAHTRQRQTYGALDETVVSRLESAPDAAAEGMAMATEAAVGLKTLPGVRGIHVFSGGDPALADEVLKAAGLV